MSNLSPEQIALERELNNILKERLQIEQALNGTQSNQANLQSVTNSMIDQNTSATKKNLESQQSNLDAMIKAGDQLEDNAGKQDLANSAATTFNKILATTGRLYESVLSPAIKYFNQFIRLDFVYNALAQSAADFSAEMRQAAEAQQASIDAFGSMSDETQKRFREFRDNAKGLADTGRSLGSIFGAGYADSFRALTEVYKAFGNEAQALNEKIQATAGQLVLLKESLGISYEAQKKLLQITHDVEEGYEDLTKTLVAGSKAFGVNIKDVGKAFNDIALDIKNFGYMTKKEMADTSVFVARLGLEVQELTSFAAGFDTFEGAAEKVSKLSAAFGIQLDTMDLVMEDNPAKKLDMVREALERSGRSIKDIAGNRREMNYLAETIGLPIEKITEMAEMSVDEFGFAKVAEESEKANKKMSKQDALNEIAKSMRTNLDLMKDLAGGGFFANMVKGFRDMISITPAYRKGMSEIHNALRVFYNLGKDVARMMSSLFYNPSLPDGEEAPFSKLFEGFIGYFKTIAAAATEVRGNLDKVKGYIVDFFSGRNMNVSSEKIMDLIFNPFIDAFSSPAAMQGFLNKDIRNAFVNITSFLADALGGALVSLSKTLIKSVESLFDSRNMKKVENAFLEPRTISRFKKTFIKFAVRFGDVLKNVFTAGQGLFAYFFGGTFNGRTMRYEDSILGGMFSSINKWFESGDAARFIYMFTSSIGRLFFRALDPSGREGGGLISSIGRTIKNMLITLAKVVVVEMNVASAFMLNEIVKFSVKNMTDFSTVIKAIPGSSYIAMLFPGLADKVMDATSGVEVGDVFNLEKIRKGTEKLVGMHVNNLEEAAKKVAQKAKSEGKALTPDDALKKAAKDISGSEGDTSATVVNLQNLEKVVDDTNSKIVEMRKNLEAIPMAKLSAVVGAGTGTELKAKMPEKVVVSTDKIQIRMSLNVSMNAQDIATSLAGQDGEYYFTVNERGALASDEVSIVEQ